MNEKQYYDEMYAKIGLVPMNDCCLFESLDSPFTEDLNLIFESVGKSSPDCQGHFHIEDITERGVEAIYEMPKKLDSNYVLGKFSGTYFILDGYSENGRYYPAELWENALNSQRIIKKLQGGMMGTHSHPIAGSQFEHSIYDSHIVKGLQINGKTGRGNSYIINTPVGNYVNTLFRAKDESGKNLIEMFVSSRGYGRFLEGNKKVPTVDPKKYILHTFDTVLTPGIALARVKIMESRGSRLPSSETTRVRTLLESLKQV